MKLSQKVLDEIDFLERVFSNGNQSTQQEKEQYFLHTVKGQQKTGIGGMDHSTPSSLFLAKRNLDMTIKMWRASFQEGTLTLQELSEEFGNHPYGQKILASIADLRKRDELKSIERLKNTPQPVSPTTDTHIYTVSLVQRLCTWVYAKYMRMRHKDVEIGSIDLF